MPATLLHHSGIADSEGVIYDFAGPYHIGKGNMAFGNPTRYATELEITASISWFRCDFIPISAAIYASHYLQC